MTGTQVVLASIGGSLFVTCCVIAVVLIAVHDPQTTAPPTLATTPAVTPAAPVINRRAKSGVTIRNPAYRIKQAALGHYVRFEADVYNGTATAIKSITVDIEYKTPERAVAWNKCQYCYEIAGGVEPGETVRIEFTPPEFSYRKEPYEQKGAFFSVLVADFENAGN